MKRIPDLLWCEIEKLIPVKKTSVGRPKLDNKRTFEGILFVLKTGIQWCELPEKYGCFTTIHGKFIKWIRAGFFKKMTARRRPCVLLHIIL
ncbi:transposase [bacterium]|nr:transposase [bacterium]